MNVITVKRKSVRLIGDLKRGGGVKIVFLVVS